MADCKLGVRDVDEVAGIAPAAGARRAPNAGVALTAMSACVPIWIS